MVDRESAAQLLPLSGLAATELGQSNLARAEKTIHTSRLNISQQDEPRHEIYKYEDDPRSGFIFESVLTGCVH